MGLDTTHDCWHGPYSSFMHWREEIAKHAGLPLRCMEGFYSFQGNPLPDDIKNIEFLPIPWESLEPDILHVLLMHSDCDGEILHKDCEPLANRLEEILPKITDDYYQKKTWKFIQGLRLAAKNGENVEFG